MRTVASKQIIQGTVVDLAEEQKARDLTDRIRRGLTDMIALRELIAEAFTTRAWATLGYESWDAYTEAEFRNMVSLSRDDQRALNVVLQLEEGMSARAAAAATGTDPKTARKDADRATGENSPVGSGRPPADPPARRVGADGKSRPATRPQPPVPEPVKPVEEDPAEEERAEPTEEELAAVTAYIQERVSQRASILAEVARIASQPTEADRLTHALAALRYAVGELLECELARDDWEASDQIRDTHSVLQAYATPPAYMKGRSPEARKEALKAMQDDAIQRWRKLGEELDPGEMIADYHKTGMYG
jgi:hypothetical protein